MAGPHNKGSFSYKTIHPNIKRILNERALLDNTAQIGMPFIKATTTISIPEFLNSADNVGFTLGLHAIETDTRAEDIYSDQNGNALIGYTYTPSGRTQRVYAKEDPDAVRAIALFDSSGDLFTNTAFSYTPPPGITSMKIGRNKNGLLASGDIQFSVPTLTQLEVLHRTFLVPGIGMVLEWGQQFANEVTPSYGESGITPTTIRDNMFPWYDRNRLIPLLQRLGRNEVGLEEILQCYVYPTQGQYMWLFGRVANFSTKANSDGSFDCSLKIIGPSEDAWAYSTRNTIVPPRDNSGKICPDGANSVESYMTTTSPGLNLKTLLEGVASEKHTVEGIDYSAWAGHVVKFDKGNSKSGEPAADTDVAPNQSEALFGDSEDAYFMTWRFFVNVVLNDETNGVKAIFKRGGLIAEELRKIALLRPYNTIVGGQPVALGYPYIDDEYENFVGNNQFLRSVDPSTMIIVNDEAVKRAAEDLQKNRPNLATELLADTEMGQKFAEKGNFYLSAAAVPGAVGSKNDRGLLSTGVWLNHKAVVQSMASSDTILRGITNLLDRMSAATLGFWQLTLDVSEPAPSRVCQPGETAAESTSMSYSVIDVNFRENAEYAVNNFIENVHIFNKYIRTKNGKLVGSELLDCTVDLSLPKRMFSQIATLGLVQPQDIQTATGEAPNAPDSPIIGDPNEALRKMFAITSLSTKEDSDQGPDLTILPKIEREALLRNATCGGAGGQTTAGTAGVGNRVAGINVVDATSKTDDQLKNQKEEAEKVLAGEVCQTAECKQVVSTAVTSANNVAAATITATQISYQGRDGSTVVVPIINDHQGDTANTRALYAAGYRNGKIPSQYLKLINRGAHRLYKDAADAFISMATQYKTATGKDIGVTDSYRPFDVQVGLIPRKGWYGKAAPAGTNFQQGLASTPGKSNHGWGLALDLVTPGGYNDPLYLWLRDNASRFGYENIPKEPWHWQYNRELIRPIDSVTPPAPSAPRSSPAGSPPAANTRVPPNCEPCALAQRQLQQANTQIASNTQYDQGKDRVVREFPGLNAVFKYIEPYGEVMSANIARDADGNSSNAFGASPGTLSIAADLVMPGVNGFRVGELFWIDRIPAFYRAFGAFQVLSIEDNIGLDGWKTTINARFNYLGDKWKQATAKKLAGAGVAPSTPAPPRTFE